MMCVGVVIDHVHARARSFLGQQARDHSKREILKVSSKVLLSDKCLSKNSCKLVLGQHKPLQV